MNSILALGSFFLLILIAVAYYFKTNQIIKINRSYMLIIFGNIFMDMAIIFLYIADVNNFNEVLFDIALRIRWISQMACTFIFYLYTEATTTHNQNTKIFDLIKSNKLMIIITIINILAYIGIFFIDKGDISKYEIYVNGPLSIYSVIVCFLNIGILSFLIIKRKSTINRAVAVCDVLSVLIVVLTTIIQKYYIPFEFATFGVTVLIYLYYFYIENPDLAIVHELEKVTNDITVANGVRMNLLNNISEKAEYVNRAKLYIEEANKLDDSYKVDINGIIKESNKLHDELTSILNVANIETNMEKITLVTYNFQDLLTKINNYAQSGLKGENVKFVISYDKSIPLFLEGDDTKIYKMITNIIDVSIKNTEVGKILLNINGNRNNGYYTLNFQIVDTGNGLTNEELNNLKFDIQKYNYTSNPRYCITKYYADLMGGILKVDSDEGVGTSTIISINQRIVNDTPLGNIEFANFDENETNYIDCKNRKIAFVDNSEFNFKIFQKLYRLYNVDCEHIKSGLELANKIKVETKYDLIIFNKNINDIDVNNIMKVLKTIDYYHMPPIIPLITAGTSNMKKEYLDLGFSDIMSIPINKFEFESIILKYLNKE